MPRKASRSRRLRVVHLSRVPAKRFFGKLTTRELLADGSIGDASVIYERMRPGTRLPTVYHRGTTEFVYCLAGTLTAVLDGRRYALRPGHILVIPPGVRHQFIAKAVVCEALSIFHPSLTIAPGADIHTE